MNRLRVLWRGGAMALALIAAAPALAGTKIPPGAQRAGGGYTDVAPVATIPALRTPAGHVTLTVSSTAAPLPSIPANATVCYLQLEGAAVRYRDDGTAPTASVGTPWAIGVQLTLFTSPLSAEQFIAQFGTATINGDCY